MSIPTFEFRLRDAANPNTARAFVDICIATKRFARNEKGSLAWSPAPNDWIVIQRAAEFRSVIEDGDVLKVVGDLNADSYFSMWCFLNDRRWKLPRIGGEYQPPVPAPVAHVPAAHRYGRSGPR